MKYIAFIVGLVLVVLIGAYLWNIVSTTFSGVGFGVPDVSYSGPDGTEISSSDNNQGGGGNIEQGSEDVVNKDPEILVSDREGVVIISSVGRHSSQSNPQKITLTSRLNAGEALSITGWKIITNDKTVTIPKGVNFYRVSGSNSEGDIIIQRGDRIDIYFTESPISENIRLNQCTGYLNEKYDLDSNFYFPKNCPRVDKSLFRHLSGDCQNYINSINGRCIIPDSNTMNSFPGSTEGNECREFLSSYFNIGYCFQENQDKEDFLDNEWRVWIDERDVFDSNHDWVRLHNKKGVLIDEYEY